MEEKSKFLLRKATVKDAKFLSDTIRETTGRLSRELYSEETIAYLYNKYSEENLKEALGDKDNNMLMAHKGTSLISCGMIESDPDDKSGKSALMSAVFTTWKEQGKGAGVFIVKELEKLAVKRGFELMKLNASRGGHGFYKHLDYADDLQTPESIRYDYIRMKKSLKK